MKGREGEKTTWERGKKTRERSKGREKKKIDGLGRPARGGTSGRRRGAGALGGYGLDGSRRGGGGTREGDLGSGKEKRTEKAEVWLGPQNVMVVRFRVPGAGNRQEKKGEFEGAAGGQDTPGSDSPKAKKKMGHA